MQGNHRELTRDTLARPRFHITADKMEIKDFFRLPSATSFFRKRIIQLRHKRYYIKKIGSV